MTTPTPPLAGGTEPPPERRSLPHRLKGLLSGVLRSTARLLLTALAALVVVYALALSYLRPPSPGRELSFDTLTRVSSCLVTGGAAPDVVAATPVCREVPERVSRVRLLDEDARVVGRMVPRGGDSEQDFWAAYPKSDAATNDLIRSLSGTGTSVSVDAQTSKRTVRFVAQFVLPLLVLADVFALLFLLVQGGGSSSGSDFVAFGRVGDKRQKRADDERVTFADVAAADEALIELGEVRDYLADPSAFAEMGALPPKGVLLVGPPGCGKTLLARAVAGEARASFFPMSGSEFVEALVGVGAARVRDLFAQARASAPAIIFIDELDAVGRQRGAGLGQGHDEREQTLNELLVQMDGFSPAHGIVVMAATNRPDILDPALLRAGRFDRHVTMERPDLEGRRQILALHATSRRLLDPGHDLDRMARFTQGFTGADLANALNEAALLAVRDRASGISRAHLEEAVDRVTSGPKRRGQLIPEEERRVVAVHEAGHALVAAAMGRTTSIQKLSIIARGRGIGHLAMLGLDKTVVQRADLEANVAMAMGGLAAEKLVYGQGSSGAESDIERATIAARDMAGRYGMSDRIGPVRVLAQNREVFLGRDYLSTQDVSQPTLEQLDTEVRRILEHQLNLAGSILRAHRELLDVLTAELLEHGTVEQPRLGQLLGRVRPHVSMAASPTPAHRDGAEK